MTIFLVYPTAATSFVVPAGSKPARSPGRPADKTKKGSSGLWLAARPLLNHLKMVAYNFTIYLESPDTETTL